MIGISPIGLFKASRISSSIFDSVLLASFPNAFNITEITKPLKRNATSRTINDEIIDPRSIPKKPVFQTSEIRFKNFSILSLLFYVYFIVFSKNY